MSKLDQSARNKLHFRWFIVVVVCIVITYCYVKAKATDNYKTILRIASENCSLEVVKFSVKNLLDINTQIPKVTALHYASGAGCLEVVEFLIDLFQNSFRKLKIVNSSYQIESQSKTFSPIAIFICNNFKSF